MVLVVDELDGGHHPVVLWREERRRRRVGLVSAHVSPQENGQLLLASQPYHGKCRRECRTVEKACDTVIDKADTEFTEILYNGVKEGLTDEQVTRYICNRAAGVCKKKTPKITSRAVDEKFEILSDEEKQMLDMQATTTTPQQ